MILLQYQLIKETGAKLSCFNVNLIKTYGYSPYFPKFASVSFKKTFSRSTTASTSSTRQDLENARIESCNSNLFACEQFDSFTSFGLQQYLPPTACNFIHCLPRKFLWYTKVVVFCSCDRRPYC